VDKMKSIEQKLANKVFLSIVEGDVKEVEKSYLVYSHFISGMPKKKNENLFKDVSDKYKIFMKRYLKNE